MTKRILAMTLCLALTLLACACAASNATVSDPESTDNKGGNTPPTSTMEQAGASAPATQMSSQPAFSDTVSTPTEPIIPEERETTLEKVLSFEIGIDGLFEYGFLYYDDPATAIPSVNGYMYTDGEGEFYQVFAGACVVRLSDGAMLPVLHQHDIYDIAICGTSFFVMGLDGIVYEYDIANGFDNATLAKKYTVFEKSEEYAEFGPIVDGRPTVQYYAKDGNRWYFDGPLYTLEKTQLKDSELLYTYVDSLRDGTSIQAIHGEIKGWAVDKNNCTVLSATAEKIVLLDQTGSGDAKVYVSYDRNGNILSRYEVHSRTYYSEEKGKSCEISFSDGDEILTLKEYRPQTLMIDDILFDDLVYDHFFVALSGEMYFAAYYLDHCDVYRINPGYSDRDYVTE
jgi:hypothetical protein